MAQIYVNHLTFGYEGSFDLIFEDTSFSIDTNWKLGFVGRNGKGKTTFLKLLLNEHPYEGTISTSTVFDYFPFPISREQLEMCAADFFEDVKADCELWQIICELQELNEEADILYRPFGTLSPGEQTKVLLAILFSGENHFLLIDEPTNHLDGNSRECVKSYLQKKKGFILVSHDRELLNACIDHVLVLNRETIEVQTGNFDSWWENKERRDHFEKAKNEKALKEISKLQTAARRTAEWADKSERTKIGFDPVKEHDRFISTRSYIGAKTKKMQSRVKQMEGRIDAQIKEKEGLLVDLETPIDLKLFPMEHHKRVIVNAREYQLRYPTGEKVLFAPITFSIENGDRTAICGTNGCGKSTLIKSILCKLGIQDISLIEKGTLEAVSGLKISYVNQDTTCLKGSIQEFCRERELNESLFCALLRQLDFGREQFSKNIEEFSEGQKKKVLLAASLMTPAQLYIWDEPLNFIDVFSRMQIEKLLLTYQPTLLFVEHDKSFCDKIATKKIVLCE